MAHLSMIACVSKDLGIGHDGQLLWQIPEDMRFFRQTTTGHPVVMGGSTFRSIGRPLPKRQNIVLSRQSLASENITQFSNLEDLQKYLHQQSDEIFIIGGASLYQAFLDQADRLYLTEVNASKPADTFFPAFDHSNYTVRVLQDGQFNGTDYQIKLYQRR